VSLKIYIYRAVITSIFVFFEITIGSGISLAADTFKGAELYATHCESCHGPAGNSVMPNAPNFAQGESMLQPDPNLLTSIKNGKDAMPSYLGILSDLEILDVIAYLRTLN